MIYLVEIEALDTSRAPEKPAYGPIRYYQRDNLPLAEVASTLAGAAGVTVTWEMEHDGNNAAFSGIAFEHSPSSNSFPGFWVAPRSESVAGRGQLLLRLGAYNITTYPMPAPGKHRYVWTMSFQEGATAPHRLWIDNVEQALQATNAGPLGAGGLANDKIYVGARAGRVVPVNGGVSTPAVFPRILSAVEIDAIFTEPNGVLVVERLATDGYATSRNDNPADVYFDERIQNPGTFERGIFGMGRTSGEAEVGYGVIEIAILDEGTGETMDRLASHAVDGRALRIFGLEATTSPWASRETVFAGTMDQIEVGWSLARVLIRDRLAELREPLQPIVYKGTTIAGGMNEAEGAADDLKDRPKPLLFGRARNIPAILANRFDRIYQVSANALSGIQAVRDRGVALTFGQDHATIAALRTATIAGGQYHTCLALGLLRVAGEPAGELTVDATEGADGQRHAAAIVGRILVAAGFEPGVDYSASDLAALSAAAPQELGIWIGADSRDILSTLTAVLDSIGGFIVPDRLGIFRIGRLLAPAAGGPVIDEDVIIEVDGVGIERIVTSDQGGGLPAHKVTLTYARSWLVQSAAALDPTATTADVKAFVSLEARQALAEDASVKARHLLSPDLTFPTLLTNEADAVAEAQRRLGIYSARRERYRVPVKTQIAGELGLDLGDAVTLRIPRFGLGAGKPMRILGITTDLQAGTTTLDLWG